MKINSELEYYSLRVRQSRAAVISAQDVCAKDAHKALATAYGKVIDQIDHEALPILSLNTAL